jgi:hypothetical protein
LDFGRGTITVAHELGKLMAAAVACFFASACIVEGGGGELEGGVVALRAS